MCGRVFLVRRRYSVGTPLTVYETRGFIPYHIALGEDYPSFAAEMQSLLAQGFMDIMASTTAVGTGTLQPFGVFTKLDATAASEVVLGTNSAAGGFAGAAIFNVWNNLPERFRSRANWCMSVSVESQIRALSTTTAGQATSYFTVDLNQDGISRLNGRPVVVTDYAPTYSSTSGHANFCVVGDFKSYIVALRSGLAIERVPMLFDTATGFPLGQRGFYAFGRAGADVAVPNGMRLLNQT
jgi:HK97 family phage major capsid protein